MFDLLVDIYLCAEATENAEPIADDGTLLYADLPAAFLRVSGQRRYLSAGAGVVIDARLATEHRSGITDRCEVRNIRTREGTDRAGEPEAYRVMFVDEGRRRGHLELDLQALT